MSLRLSNKSSQVDTVGRKRKTKITEISAGSDDHNIPTDWKLLSNLGKGLREYTGTQQICTGDSFNICKKKMHGYSLKNGSKENGCAKRIGMTYGAGEQMHGQRRIGFQRV